MMILDNILLPENMKNRKKKYQPTADFAGIRLLPGVYAHVYD